MAIPRGVPLHFISTASVAKVTGSNSALKPLLEVPATPAIPALLDSVDGYAASKWCSERLLEEVAAGNELPFYVHRLAHVVGQDASELDAVGMLFKYSLLLQALPRIEPEDITGLWDFVKIDVVARDIVKSVIDSATHVTSEASKSVSPECVRFINHCSSEKIVHEDFRSYLEDLAGVPLSVIEMKDWLKKAHEKGLHPLVYDFLSAFSEGRGHMVLPLIAKGASR